MHGKTSNPALEMGSQPKAELWKEAIADQHANVTGMISQHTSLHITLLKIHIPGMGMQSAQLVPVTAPPPTPPRADGGTQLAVQKVG